MSFSISASDSTTKARAGLLKTPHGVEIETPVFMPVATQAAVKALSQEDMEALGVRALLANSYHLYLRPGIDVIREAGGLHKFMSFDGMLLTDSGGYQVLSLSELRTITDEGVKFRSHIDGSSHMLTPEKVIEIQSALGSDCWTTLDECPPYPSTEDQARAALEQTMRWSDRSIPALKRERENGKTPLFFPILQGGFYPALRRRAAEHLDTLPWDGVSIGGFSVGEPKELTWSVLNETTSALPKDKPRYLMGVGTPRDLWDAVTVGIDMMDCVWPTRVARNGQAMTRRGKLNVTNQKFRRDFTPLDPDCKCRVCARYSRAYIGHLFRAKELLVHQLISYHNLHFMAEITAIIRRSLKEGTFSEERKKFFELYKDDK